MMSKKRGPHPLQRVDSDDKVATGTTFMTWALEQYQSSGDNTTAVAVESKPQSEGSSGSSSAPFLPPPPLLFGAAHAAAPAAAPLPPPPLFAPPVNVTTTTNVPPLAMNDGWERMDTVDVMQLELVRRLHEIQRETSIPVNSWNWPMLEWLENQTGDLWTLIVYSCILLARSGTFTTTTQTTPRERRRYVHAALCLAVKMLHDGNHRIQASRVEYELRLADALHWNLDVDPAEFQMTSMRWMLMS